MAKEIAPTYETFDALTVGDDGATTWLAAKPMSDQPGFDAYLVPYYVLSDRGSYFVPGSLNKTAKEKCKAAPHLWQHDTWEPIGKHLAADPEDPKGFRVSVTVNEATQRGAEVMSNLRFGVPLGVSIGFDTIRDRSGNDNEDEKLDRRTAPDYLKNVPINELRAITEARWWESSSVTFAGIATAKPDEIRSAARADVFQSLLSAITAGTLSGEQLAQAEAFVRAWEQRAAAGFDHGTRAPKETRRVDIEFESLFMGFDLAALGGTR